jgi:hypothetical protein
MTVHRFKSTESAYDATQCDVDVKKGDILVIGNIIGVADTWPFAVTKEHGQLHDVLWESQETRDWWRKNMTSASWLELLTTIKSEGIETDQLAAMFVNEFQGWLHGMFGFSLYDPPYHDDHVRALPGEILERRLTHGYVGSWKHLDQHEYVGRMLIEATSTLGDEVDPEDPCEPCTTTLFVKVYSGEEEEAVKSALRDHFTAWGCSHEYDCCGCRSYRAGNITRLGSGYWRVTQHSSRNY